MSVPPAQPDTDRLANLRALLKARDGKPGYADNVKTIRAEIERLEKEQGNG